MKIFLLMASLVFLLTCCAREDDNSAAQQLCYFAASNTCESVAPVVTLNGKEYLMTATASFPTKHTGLSNKGECSKPVVGDLPMEKIEHLTCGPRDRDTADSMIVEGAQELECPVMMGGKFILTVQNLEMKALWEGNEIELKCNGFEARRTSAP